MTYFDLIWNPQYPKKALIFKLIEFYTGKTKDQIHLEYNDPMDSDAEQKVIDGYRRYVDGGEPLEYITDNVSFLGNHFHIDGRALIPRPETEYMIQSVIDRTHSSKLIVDSRESQLSTINSQLSVLIDVGTWCGVLGLSSLLLAPQAWSHAYLTDYEPQIIELTRKNLSRHQSEITNRGSQSTIELITASMLDWVNSEHVPPHGDSSLVRLRNSHDNIVIVANLPYIPETTFDQNVDESAKKWEPREAFVWGDDWLDRYRIMFGQLFDLQSSGLTTPVTMFLEMMTRQMEILEREFGERIQFSVTKTFHFNIIIVQGIIK